MESNLSKKKINKIFIIIFFCIAGIPPVSLFFFKFQTLLVLFKSKYILYLITYLIFNTFIVYFYYKTFKYLLLQQNLSTRAKKIYLQRAVYDNFFFYFFFFTIFNVFFVFFIDFITQCF
jgi:NADH:ubiquinone oxidoreductase subunit 2 (subunit N)